jgi:hypothetical protein
MCEWYSKRSRYDRTKPYKYSDCGSDTCPTSDSNCCWAANVIVVTGKVPEDE